SENNLIPYAQQLDTALDKIKGMLTSDEWAAIRSLMPNISVRVDSLQDTEDQSEKIEEIAECINLGRGMKMIYSSFSSGVEQEREIDPYHLFNAHGAWYVVGYCYNRKNFRTFKVDRIRKLLGCSRIFQRPDSFSINKYIGQAWSFVGGERFEVQIHFSPPVSRLVMEGNWHPTQHIEELDDDKVLFKVAVDGLDEIKRWVLTFGEHAEVIEPQSLRQSIQVTLEKLRAIYQ
ncbi:MAG: WYL domain-containing protein, partial [bacterium]|nr:WYL domain-containing protein [bacterium]